MRLVAPGIFLRRLYIRDAPEWRVHAEEMNMRERPIIGQRCEVRGVPCQIIAVLPAGTVEVEALDGSGRCWRVSGLGFA